MSRGSCVYSWLQSVKEEDMSHAKTPEKSQDEDWYVLNADESNTLIHPTCIVRWKILHLLTAPSCDSIMDNQITPHCYIALYPVSGV